MDLAGKKLRYLIGSDGRQVGHVEEVTEVGYWTEPALHGVSVGYCNLFDEENTGKLGPYLHDSDTAAQYGEGQIDPRGSGWERNLAEQFRRRKRQGFNYVELDNADAYSVRHVLGAVKVAKLNYGLRVIAKNPLLLEGFPLNYVRQCHGIIVERDAGNPKDMHALRSRAGMPDMPVWFVAFGAGRGWADETAGAAKDYLNMFVTYSSRGEYENSVDL